MVSQWLHTLAQKRIHCSAKVQRLLTCLLNAGQTLLILCSTQQRSGVISDLLNKRAWLAECLPTDMAPPVVRRAILPHQDRRARPQIPFRNGPRSMTKCPGLWPGVQTPQIPVQFSIHGMQGPTAKLGIPGITREDRCPDRVNCGIWENNLLTLINSNKPLCWFLLGLELRIFTDALPGRITHNLNFKIGSVLFCLCYFASRAFRF